METITPSFKNEEDRNIVSETLHKENERIMRDITFGIPSYRRQRRSSNQSTTTMVLVG